MLPGERGTYVIYGIKNVADAVIRFASSSEIRIDACVDHTRPSLAVEIDLLKKYFIGAKKRGVRLRYVTEITKENIGYCKKLVKMVDELRHLESIKGNFYLSEREYLGPATKHARLKPARQIIYSNTKEVLSHQQYVFDSFWNRAIPAEQRLADLEQGRVRYETRIFDNKDDIFDQARSLAENSRTLSVVSDKFLEPYRSVFQRNKKHQRGDIRWITIVNAENIDLVKRFLGSGIKIRHVKNMPPMNFAIGDKKLNASIEKMDRGRTVQTLLASNEPVYIKHFESLFEELWKNGIEATSRIRDIEKGEELPNIEVIQNSTVAGQVYLNTVASALEEIMIMFPSPNAFLRQERLGIIKSIVKKVAEKKGEKNERETYKIKARLLLPAHKLIQEKVEELKNYENIGVRFFERPSDTRATFMVADRKTSLVMEIKDDSKQTFEEAIGFSTYSTSEAGVLSFVSIFENFWNQAELYRQVKEANMHLELAIDQLKVHDEMQREFINIAAHELRNPIQPILGLSEVLRSEKVEGGSERDTYLLDTIIRNARRLKHVSENLLDVSKIESQSLRLNKEIIEIDDVISSIVADYRVLIEKGSGMPNSNLANNLKLIYHPLPKDVFVEADKYRLIQVISNLLTNAIAFTKDHGTIEITPTIKYEDQVEVVRVQRESERRPQQQQQNMVVIAIKDSGSGIPHEMLHKLFSKFVTKSTFGSGLGLFISKSIVEAHGGKIWATNNENQKGATFTFSLPISSSHEQIQS